MSADLPLAGFRAFTHVRLGLEPYAHTEFGTADGSGAYLAVVPPQCRFATTTTPADPGWTPEPTGSYIVRTEPTTQPEWWQVDCGGDVRAELPAPTGRTPPDTPTEAHLDQTLTGVRVQVDRTVARQCVQTAAQPHPFPPVTGIPTLIWIGDYAGPPSAVAGGLPPSDRAAVAIARLDKGGWAVQFLIGWSSGSPGWTPAQEFTAAGDPTRP